MPDNASMITDWLAITDWLHSECHWKKQTFRHPRFNSHNLRNCKCVRQTLFIPNCNQLIELILTDLKFNFPIIKHRKELINWHESRNTWRSIGVHCSVSKLWQHIPQFDSVRQVNHVCHPVRSCTNWQFKRSHRRNSHLLNVCQNRNSRLD